MQILYQHLINEKCRAPFKSSTGESFHNAFIADILADEDEDDVTVKVFFLNPLQDKMKACEYFFTNRCTFEDNCRFSHGEVLKYSALKPYQHPNYKQLKSKTHVLVKVESLWKPGSVVECSQKLKTCQVKLHTSGTSFDCPFSDVLPPLETNSDSSDLSTEEDEDFESSMTSNVLQIDDKFGEWEKFTTGIGSRILQKFGYKNGEGLGLSEFDEGRIWEYLLLFQFLFALLGKDGITEPISAKIYVQGKSLDYNMELSEKKQRETVEQKVKRESLKQQRISERNYSQNENEVFSFLNNTICNIKPSSSTAAEPKPENVKSQTKAQLNLSNFKIEEDIKKVELALRKLKESSKRQSIDATVLKNIQRQMDEKQRSLDSLQRSLSDVNNEQKSRREKSKLTIF